ncbi:MAG TPA: ATP-binding protein [Symbiobacteriaceae bacterium]|nr:ATP-binding protein [Symbiobacteriaceae bacterium]
MTVKLCQPVDFVTGNMLITPKRDGPRQCWVGYELLGTHYDFLSEDRAAAYHSAITRLFRELSGIAEAHLAMVPEQIDAAGIQAQLLHRLDGDAAEYCQQVADALAEMQESEDDICRYRFLLWIRLPAKKALTWADLRGVRKTSDIRHLLGGASVRASISEEHLAEWARQERKLRDLLQNFGASVGLGFRALFRQECLLFSRAPLWQGIAPPPMLDDWAPDATVTGVAQGKPGIQPDDRAMRRMYSGLITHTDEGYVQVTQFVDGAHRSAYQAFLTVEQFAPNPLPILGSEWSYDLQQVGPVSLHLHWTVRGYELTMRDLESQKRKQADTADQEHTHGDGESADTARSRDEAEEMELFIKDTRSPSLMLSVVIGVSAPSLELLQERIRMATAVFDRVDIRLVLNASDQVKHLWETFPGACRLIDDYIHRLLPPALATCMFGATDMFMDPSGTFFAVDPNGRPLWFDWLRALAKLDASGSMAFVGPMGSGKSTAANFIAFLCALFGAKVLAIDSAKPERSLWPEKLPFLGPFTRVVTLSAHDKDRGKLDPYVIFSDKAEATVHAISQASFLTQTDSGAPGYDVLMKAFRTVRDNCERPCMQAGISALDRLAADSTYTYRAEAARLAERLRNMATMAYSSLLFGDGTNAGIDITCRITVLQLDRLRRPADNKAVKDYDLEEYVSAAILNAVVAFASAFATQDRRVQKLIVTDEARWFLSNSYGRDLIEKQTLTGRAMGAQVLLIGQNVSHLPPDLHQHFTLRFAFGADFEREAINNLEFLGVEPTQANIERVMSLNPKESQVPDEEHDRPRPAKGQCLIRDLTGRVGQAQICLLFSELAEAFKTTSLEERVYA